MNRRTVLWAVPSLALCGGCAPRILIENPPDWPPRWAERDLYTTPDVFIYASTDTAAGEADRLYRQVVNEFQAQTGGQAVGGLIIVTDVDDALFQPDARRLFGLTQRSEALSRGETAPSDADLQEAWEAVEERMYELGVGVQTSLRMTPFQLTRDQFSEVLDFPGGVPAGVDWAVSIPTRAVLHKCNRVLMQASLKEAEVGIATQVLLAPMIALVESTSENAAAAVRDTAIFARLAHAQPDWSRNRIREEILAYAEQKIEEAMGPLADHAKTEVSAPDGNVGITIQIDESSDEAAQPGPGPRTQPADADGPPPQSRPGGEAGNPSLNRTAMIDVA